MDDAVVLIVDDNRPLARSIAELLRRRAFRAVVATTAGRALRLARRLHPDLVIADVDLPDLTGHELADRIAADAPGVRVILVSAGLRVESAGQALPSVFATLDKPFDPLHLVALVRQALGRVTRGAVESPLVPVPRLLPARHPAGARLTTALVRRMSRG